MRYTSRSGFQPHANPILVQLREEHEIWKLWQREPKYARYAKYYEHQDLAWTAQIMIRDLNHDWVADFTPDQIAHALKVLQKIVSFSK